MAIPAKPFTPRAGAEYFLEVSFRAKADLPWAKRGHELAWDQFELPESPPGSVANTGPTPAPGLTQDEGQVLVTGTEFAVRFDKHTGALASLKYQGTELIESPLRPDFWRAVTDNDRGREMEQAQGIWRTAHEEAQVKSVSVKEVPPPHAVEVAVTLALPKVDAEWTTTYTVYASGDIVVHAGFDPAKTSLPKLPRLGMQMTLPAGFEQLTWLGPGPEETYTDRKDAKVGLYQGTVSQQFYADYTEPGETGNKVDVRWLALRNAKGVGLLAVGMPLLSANALHYGTADLTAAAHPFELPRRDTVTLNLDLRQQGVGGDDSWGAWPHAEHLISCTPSNYSFRLRPLSSHDDPAKLARTQPAN
jgi:beta-galactosidase